MTGSLAQRVLGARPGHAPQLHAWVKHMLGFDIPRRPLIPGHDAPFDYLCHAFFEDRPQRDALVWAGRGAGKTQIGAIATLLDLLFKPGIEICILGGSFAQSSRMHAHLRRLLEREPFIALVDGHITLTHVQLRNGSRVEVLSQSHTAVRGRRAHRLRCDEVEEFDDEVWEAAQMITRSGQCGDVFVRAGVEALSTMHRPFGLMSRLTQQARDSGSSGGGSGGTRLFRWSVIDTLELCPPSRLCEQCPLFADGCDGAAKRPRPSSGFFHIDDALGQRQRVSPRAWRAEMLCQRPDASDCVYPEFDEAMHVFDDDAAPANDASLTWLGGMDFGYRAPSVLLLAALDGGNVLHVMDEIVESGCTTPRMIDLARSRCANLGITDSSAGAGGRLRWIGADPAGLQRSDQTGLSTITLWRRAGFAVRTRGMTIEAGVEAVRARLSDGTHSVGLRVHRRCAHLIRALREYHFDPSRPTSETPVKDGPDHAADALRYLVVNLDGGGGGEAQVRGY